MNPIYATALLRSTMLALGLVEGDHFRVTILGLPGDRWSKGQTWASLTTDATRLDKALTADEIHTLAIRLATLGFRVELWHLNDAPCTVSAMQPHRGLGLLENTFSFTGVRPTPATAILAEGAL